MPRTDAGLKERENLLANSRTNQKIHGWIFCSNYSGSLNILQLFVHKILLSSSRSISSISDRNLAVDGRYSGIARFRSLNSAGTMNGLSVSINIRSVGMFKTVSCKLRAFR